jgi:hypothetical protein
VPTDFAKWNAGRDCDDGRFYPSHRQSQQVINSGSKWGRGSAAFEFRSDVFSQEDPALDALIENSKYIPASGDFHDEYSWKTWRRATDYLRRLSLLADTRNRELPLPRITAAGEGSIDLLWCTRVRMLLLNFPGDELPPTFFYRKEPIELTGVLKNEAATEEFLRWLSA